MDWTLRPLLHALSLWTHIWALITHKSWTSSIFLSSSSSPFPHMKHNPTDPPPQPSLTKSGGKAGKFYSSDVQKTNMESQRRKMHISSFCVRQFNVHTAVILPHVHEKEDSSLFLWAPSDLSSAHKTNIPVLTLICAQHMHTHFTVSGTARVCCSRKHSIHTQQHTLNSTTPISSKIHNWSGLYIKRSSLAAAQESDVQEK